MTTFLDSVFNRHAAHHCKVVVVRPILPNLETNLFLDLNRSLDKFWNDNAHKETVEDWLDAHPFQEAEPDDADPVWTSK